MKAATTNVAVKLLLVAALFGLSTTSCTSCDWQKRSTQSLVALHESAAGLSRVTEPYFMRECVAAAKACAEVQDKKCPKAMACLDTFAKINKAIISTRVSIHAGQAAVAIGDKDGATAKIAEIVKTVAEITAILRDADILP